MNNLQQHIINSSIEDGYSATVSIEHRKKFAQFFTPFDIADLMAKWVLGSSSLQTVLEPAFGLGIFSRALLSYRDDIRIKAFEIDKVIFETAKEYFENVENIDLHLEDYMYNDWENKYDGIICNPPYFKFHDYDNKSILQEIERHLKTKLNGFTNLYALFLLKAIHQLNPNGRCAFIIPSEFLNADYGKLVKDYLVKSNTLRHIIVIDFEENVFDDALTTASIILCAKDNLCEKIQFTNIQTLQDLKTAEKIIEFYPLIPETKLTYKTENLNPEIKWKAYYQEQNGPRFKQLVPFSNYAKVVRGIATGSNEYFTFNLSKSQKYAIDKLSLLPCICSAKDATKPFFTQQDFEELKNNNKSVFLFNPKKYDNENVLAYIRKGESEKINERFLTSQRTPWYALENRPPAPIWVSVFNRTGLRFIRNEANISNLTSFHCIYPKATDLFSVNNVDLLFAYLLTDTAKEIFQDNSREYGNGLQKFEPNDLNKGMMLNIEKLEEKSKSKIIELYYQYRIVSINNGEAPDTLINEIDEIFKNELI
ncbi:MAG TPA: N-6 DNA methylase [Dysgonamonadaceae bacterium]|jgi:adenine-specific DNA-methyltransferase|nr:N-6 DNA methylase [Dysgonamonadaceae bacterium]HUH73675.1 N-6 DNA methylase [Chitinophagales bacterium]